MCIPLSTIVAHNIAQNRPDSFPPYPPDNHHISDDVYLREGGNDEHYMALMYRCVTVTQVYVFLLNNLKPNSITLYI